MGLFIQDFPSHTFGGRTLSSIWSSDCSGLADPDGCSKVSCITQTPLSKTTPVRGWDLTNLLQPNCAQGMGGKEEESFLLPVPHVGHVGDKELDGVRKVRGNFAHRKGVITVYILALSICHEGKSSKKKSLIGIYNLKVRFFSFFLHQ